MLARPYPALFFLSLVCSQFLIGSQAVSPAIASDVGDGKLLPWDHWQERHQLDNSTSLATVKPVVLIVPGMMNNDDSMSIFKQAFSDQEIPAAMFRYDSLLGVEPVALKLAQFLKTESELHPNRKIILLTHSMGGVVSRRAVEDPSFRINCVSQLIMIAPPNAGSTLAALQGESIKELVEGLSAQEMAGILGKQGPDAINETLGLYVGNAKVDLAPESQLLKKVNGFKRNPNIRYTVIAGTKAPIPEIAFGVGGLLLQQFGFGNGGVVDRFGNLIKTVKRDEWIDGRGDGAVTIESTRLPDVSDHVQLPFAHCDTCRDPEAETNKKLLACVMQRLSPN